MSKVFNTETGQYGVKKQFLLDGGGTLGKEGQHILSSRMLESCALQLFARQKVLDLGKNASCTVQTLARKCVDQSGDVPYSKSS